MTVERRNIDIHLSLHDYAKVASLLGPTLQTMIERVKRDHEVAQREMNELCVRYNGLSISGAFAKFLKSMIEILEARAEERRIAGAPEDEQDTLVRAIRMISGKYDRVTADVRFHVSRASR
jgi:hypothetical protein